MKPPRSLRSRLLAGFAALGAVIVFSGAAFLVMTFLAGQESILQRMLLAEVDAFLAARKLDATAPPPQTAVVSSYVGEAALPGHIRSNLHRFEAEDDEGVTAWEWREIQLWQGEVPGLSGRLYVLAGHNESAGTTVLMPNLTRGVSLLALCVGGTLFWLSRLFSRRLSEPLRRLAAELEGFDPVAGIPPSAGPDTPAELLPVFSAFARMRDRLDEFVLRERGFTRDASHELRTPLAVVQGAAALLRRDAESGRAGLPVPVLARIEQAVEDMSATVGACLWLAREREPPARLSRAPVADLLRRLVETHRSLLGERTVRVELVLEVESLEDFPLEGLRLVASNLVRNAFLYTTDGCVRVTLRADGLRVCDTGPGLPADALAALAGDRRGPGIGLRLVLAVCERLGWRLQHRPGPDGRGTEFSIVWSS
jgi:signal transduction histidine kinase